MCRTTIVAGALLALFAAGVFGWPEDNRCDVSTCIAEGCMCGRQRWAENGATYASFLAVPYAKQPVGERRFKELEPLEPWSNVLIATTEGPACDQEDVIYKRIMQPRGFSEACIHANIYVPLPPNVQGFVKLPKARDLPVLVFVHGGGFQGGSGDPDLHGPEYLVTNNVIVITFNYRLNVFGFLSLNSAEVPGNQGLRDQVTLLRWVQRNARAFGGDPDNVTLMGQSAGATSVHLLTLSEATNGLYKRAFLMSGTAISGFYSSSPIYAQQLSGLFLTILGINATAPASEIHQQLIEVPVEKIHEANKMMLNMFGLTTFVPTVEQEFPGVTRIIDDDPEVLVAKGRGKDVPLVIGFTDVECEVFRPRLEEIDIASKIADNLVLTVPANVIFSTQPEFLPDIAKKIDQLYYNGTVNTDGFIQYCTDGLYKYPAMKLAHMRSKIGGAPVFLYQFSYQGEYSVLRDALKETYTGAAHIEDLTYVFRVNSMLGTHKSFPPTNMDDRMKKLMTMFVTNFMKCSYPVCRERYEWPPVKQGHLQLLEIHQPAFLNGTRHLNDNERNILQFFGNLTLT